MKPLVDYPDDDDDEDVMDANAESVTKPAVDLPERGGSEAPLTPVSTTSLPSPPERLSEKRRREDEDDDELVRLAWGPKRRSSNASAGSKFRGNPNEPKATSEANSTPSTPKKIAINLGSKSTPTSPKGAGNRDTTNGDGGG